MKTEEPYFDKNGKEITEFAVIKVFHFIGRRRKKHFMYKWVRLIEYNDMKYWVAKHLESDSATEYYHLRSVANKDTRVIHGTEIVQQS